MNMRLKVTFWRVLLSVAGAVVLWAAVVNAGGQAEADSGKPATVAAISFEITGIEEDHDRWTILAGDLIAVHPGDAFKKEVMQRAEKSLVDSGFFESVETEIRHKPQGDVAMLFRLRPLPLIQDIRVKGAFPIFEREVLNALTIHTGGPYGPSSLEGQEERIVDLFKREGFYGPRVSVWAEKEKESHHVTVMVDIQRGAFNEIRNVSVIGNQFFSGVRLKMRTETWKSSFLPGGMSRFNKKKLDEDLKNLMAFYRDQQFADVEIAPLVEMDDANNDVSITFRITEGPRYEIDFEGNREFWDCTLKGELVLFKEGNRKELGLRKSMRNIQERYRKAGYSSCRVRMESDLQAGKTADIRNVRFVITEGVRSLVREVKISGNRSISEEKIRGQILTRPPGIFSAGELVPAVLEDDIQAVRALYLDQGFRGVDVDRKLHWQEDPDKQRRYATVTLAIREGIQTTVASVATPGLDALDRQQVLEGIALKPGEPFSNRKLERDANTISAAVSEKGYPHVQVKGKADISADGMTAVVNYAVTLGPFVRMGRTHVVGNFRTRKGVVEEEMELAPGEPFSLKRMLESQRNIHNLKAFSTATTRPLGFKENADRVHLLVEVEERKPYYLQAGVGFDTSKRMYVNGRAGDHNLFGLNKDAWAGGEVSEIGNKIETGIAEPRFLGTRIAASFTVFREKREEFNKDFGSLNSGATLSFQRGLPLSLTAGLSFSYERKEQYMRDGREIPEGEEESYQPRGVLVVTPSLTHNSVDSFIRPSKGWFSSLSVDVSRGVENSLDNFIKYRLEGRWFYTPHKKLTLALRGRIGQITLLESDSSIPADQLFFLGGVSDVRGYDENKLRFNEAGDAVGGKRELLASIEARFDIGWNLEFVAFLDSGSVQDATDESDDDDFRSAVGGGFRYLTPVCPIGFLYGHKLNRLPGEKNAGRLHFSIGYTF